MDSRNSTINKNTPRIKTGLKRSGLVQFFKRLGIAAVSAILAFTVVIYLHSGTLWDFSFAGLIQLLYSFLFFFSLFWVQEKISSIVNSTFFQSTLIFIRAFSEFFMVVVSALLLNLLLNHLPILIFYTPDQLDPDGLRIGYVFSAIISLFFYYFVERERSKKRLQAERLRSARLQKESFQAQLESLKNQVNPHFLFNSLNVLGALIHKNPDKAEKFVEKLSDVYRSFLDHSPQMLVPLHKELEIVDAYMYLLDTRFEEALRFEKIIPEEKLSLQLPPGALQMLIENAVKHNTATMRKPLVIKIYTDEKNLVVSNELQLRKEDVPSTKTGLANIQSRYAFYTEEKVQIEKDGNQFTVKLPLLKVETYESSNY
ncbi:sensor histidine kinase [Planktosalinus lacus]|nr:histidine kinase [Planktosalinus lacus]